MVIPQNMVIIGIDPSPYEHMIGPVRASGSRAKISEVNAISLAWNSWKATWHITGATQPTWQTWQIGGLSHYL